MTLLFIIYLLMIKFGWVNLSTVLAVVSLKNAIPLLKIVNKSSGLMTPLTIPQASFDPLQFIGKKAIAI